MIESSFRPKKKICKTCSKEDFIWSGGNCKVCASKISAQKKKRNYKKKLKRKKRTLTPRQKKIKEIDRDLSLLVRALSAVKGKVKCYTCGKEMKWKGGEAQNSHFHGRGKMCLRWDLDNCKVGCNGCNVELSGNLDVYEANLRRDYGDEFIADLKFKGNQVCRYTINDLETIHSQIKQQLNAVLKEKNL